MKEKSFTLLKPKSKNLNKKMISSSVSTAKSTASSVSMQYAPPLHKKSLLVGLMMRNLGGVCLGVWVY